MLNIGLYGLSGHQIHGRMIKPADARVRLAAVAGFSDAVVKEMRDAGAAAFDVLPSLDALLARPDIGLISLCSPRRAGQAAESVRCLEAGKHVYAEKPCALREEDLERIIVTARRTGRLFHEMAGTVFDQPYYAMRQIVASGTLGEIVQVLAQKSYPMHPNRPQDEAVDGGLIAQVGIHAVRMVEQVSGLRVTAVDAVETSLGNPVPFGGLHMASSLVMRLGNGGLATVIANYLNPHAFGSWGNETLRLFGTRGMIESTDGGQRTRLVLDDRDAGPLDLSTPAPDWFDALMREILDGQPMPLTLDDELHPTRLVLRASLAAKAHTHWGMQE